MKALGGIHRIFDVDCALPGIEGSDCHLEGIFAPKIRVIGSCMTAGVGSLSVAAWLEQNVYLLVSSDKSLSLAGELCLPKSFFRRLLGRRAP